jgi:transcriptional regulator GlxA family with amidase domain
MALRHEARSVVFFVYDGLQLLDLAGPSDVFDAANRLGATPPYELTVTSPHGASVRAASGIRVDVDAPAAGVDPPVHTLIVTGGHGHVRVAEDPRAIGGLRHLVSHAIRIASVCTGITPLAATGALEGCRVTTHWSWAAGLARRHPELAIDADAIYIVGDGHATAAGVTSGIDLALALVERDHDPELARAIARWLVVYRHRPGSQAQMSPFTEPPPPESETLRRALDHVHAHHTDPGLNVTALANTVGLTTRHLTRLFRRHFKVTPGLYLQRIRIDTAAGLLARTGDPIASVAARSGFATTETLRRGFTTVLGTSPSAYRRTQLSAG